MKEDYFIISFDGSPLVVVRNAHPNLPTDILDWYAKEYAFDRNRLSWSVVHSVTWDGGDK